MSNDISLQEITIVGNHSSESQTTIAENEKLLNDLDEEIKDQRSNVTRDKENQQTKIQRVPNIMLHYKKNKFYYKPREVSIGPIHAESSNLSKRDLKIKLAARFVMASGETSKALLGKIKAKVNELRKCFDERVIVNYDDDDRLSQLLFLDGCFLLQFVESYFSDSLKDFKITNAKAAVISNDLLLAENQIPFLVLKLLIDSYSYQNGLTTMVLEFVARNVPIGYLSRDDYLSMFTRNVAYHKSFPNPYVRDWVHLLDLLRAVQIFGLTYLIKDEDKSKDKRNYRSCYYKFQSRASGCFSPCFTRIKRLFGLINTIIIIKKSSGKYEWVYDMFHKKKDERTPRSVRNVQEVKLSGIKLRPSGSCSLTDISFSTKYFISGQLKLPAFAVDNSTASKLLNLVAYEMCMDDYETNCMVTSYVNFLDLLIDNEQDVKDLRAAHILRNHLSSDAEVAHLINKIGYCCGTAPKDAYLKVKNEIQRHHERKITIWMAQFYNDQFKSPWTVIALLAASIILILTAIQAWYAVYPKKN